MDARNTALSVLNMLSEGNKTLDSIVEDIMFEDRRERALFNALVYGVLRWRGKTDYIIAHFSKTGIEKIDIPIMNILRLGLFQIMYLDRVPKSAAVNTSVEMAKSFGEIWTVRFVNGLLRNAVRNHKDIPFPDIRKDPISALSSGKSFPEWLIRRWLKRFGIEETEKICDAINEIPPLTLRVNTLKTSREELMNEICDDAAKIEITPYSPIGLLCFGLKKPVSEMKSFQQGWFQVQDEAAQSVAYLLNPQPGEKILDACAGLGGKTGAIAQLMKNQGILISIDKDERKLPKLETEMKRLGVTMVRTSAHDLNSPISFMDRAEDGFDRILIDAPCSGLGVMRRNPDIKWSSSEKNTERCGKKQSDLLENSGRLLKPGGVLVYAVCSTEPEENESVIRAFLNNHSEFEIENNQLPESVRQMVNEEGYFKTFPHIHKTDGFFAVCLQKRNMRFPNAFALRNDESALDT